ncbi:hypothetical protein DFJ73DRAFT_923667 [Zopfochytrium polystomum]|nr:hypothetical protein DFJ73DRAFT_923667 [Zopfochytrium polystomum]
MFFVFSFLFSPSRKENHFFKKKSRPLSSSSSLGTTGVAGSIQLYRYNTNPDGFDGDDHNNDDDGSDDDGPARRWRHPPPGIALLNLAYRLDAPRCSMWSAAIRGDWGSGGAERGRVFVLSNLRRTPVSRRYNLACQSDVFCQSWDANATSLFNGTRSGRIETVDPRTGRGSALVLDAAGASSLSPPPSSVCHISLPWPETRPHHALSTHADGSVGLWDVRMAAAASASATAEAAGGGGACIVRVGGGGAGGTGGGGGGGVLGPGAAAVLPGSDVVLTSERGKEPLRLWCLRTGKRLGLLRRSPRAGGREEEEGEVGGGGIVRISMCRGSPVVWNLRGGGVLDYWDTRYNTGEDCW